MIIIKEKKNCCGCEACINICPKKCIKMVEDDEGFRYPIVDKEKCINCKLCEKVCQYINKIDLKEKENYPIIYACTQKNINNIKNSTTIGIFYELGKKVIEDNGIVVGATYDKDMHVQHKIASDLKTLDEMRGSKYVQSEINDIYKKIHNLLNDNKFVLFSGTPCQVGGLIKFLGKQYDNLLTVDIICHSVPSPKIFKDYIKETEKIHNSKITKINFRNKINGWLNPYTEIEFTDGNKTFIQPSSKNEWYRVFTSHIIDRPSCSNCLYTSIKRISDITLGDFWGIDKINPKIDYFYGVGKIFINTEQGRKFFELIRKEYNTYQMTIKDSIRPNLIHPPEVNPKKISFYKEYKRKGFFKAYQKYVNDNIYTKIKRRIIKIIKGRK